MFLAEENHPVWVLEEVEVAQCPFLSVPFLPNSIAKAATSAGAILPPSLADIASPPLNLALLPLSESPVFAAETEWVAWAELSEPLITKRAANQTDFAGAMPPVSIPIKAIALPVWLLADLLQLM